MKKKFLSMSFVLLAGFELFAQNPNMIVAPNYFNGSNLQLLPTPLIGNNNTPDNSGNNPYYYVVDGYDGQAASGAQNIILNNDGEIMFFVIDAGVYDRHGNSLGIFLDDSSTGDEGPYVNGIASEVVIVPVPNRCNEYYLISTRKGGFENVAEPLYGKVIVNYDNNGNLIAGSGLVDFTTWDTNDNHDHARKIASLIGSTYPDSDAVEVA